MSSGERCRAVGREVLCGWDETAWLLLLRLMVSRSEQPTCSAWLWDSIIIIVVGIIEVSTVSSQIYRQIRVQSWKWLTATALLVVGTVRQRGRGYYGSSAVSPCCRRSFWLWRCCWCRQPRQPSLAVEVSTTRTSGRSGSMEPRMMLDVWLSDMASSTSTKLAEPASCFSLTHKLYFVLLYYAASAL